MTKVIQSTIAEKQSEAASVPLNFESKVYRQRTGLFDSGVTTALASLTPYTPLSFEGAATAERQGIIATANIPVVAGLTHLPGDKARFVGPQIAPRAGDFRYGGMAGLGTASDRNAMYDNMVGKKPVRSRYRKRKGEEAADVDRRFRRDFDAWQRESVLPGTYYRCYKEGLADWLLGIDPVTSREQWSAKDNFNAVRLDYWKKTVPDVKLKTSDYVLDSMSQEAIPFAAPSTSNVAAGYGNVDGSIVDNVNAPVMLDAALPIGIRQFETDEIATNYIANNKNRVVIGYTIGTQAVKLFYTPAAIDMVVRRFNSIYQLFGTMNPRISYLGRGHLRTKQRDENDPQKYKLWTPPASDDESLDPGNTPYLHEPNLNWSCGAVPYNTKQLPANGPIYIDQNQFGWRTRKTFCKYNHVMTQLGLAFLETVNAFGAGLGEQLNSMSNPFKDTSSSATIAGLQMLFAALYGTTPATSIASDDFTEAAGASAAHARTNEIMGMFFNPGHSHIDPGVLVYQNSQMEDGIFGMLSRLNRDNYSPGQDERWDTKFNNASGILDETDTRYQLADMRVSAALLMKEAIGRLFVFSVMGAALAPHMTVPTMGANLEYRNNAGRDTVIEVLKLAHRPGVYADGSSGNKLPFDFIDSRITDQVVGRIPCYLRETSQNRGMYNAYIGQSTPDLMGDVVDKVSENGTCVTLIEGDDIQFTPIVRGSSGTLQTKRKGVTISIVNLRRPEYYEPGVSRLGMIYGLMSDNASVGGDYFIQPGTGVFHDPRVGNTIYRSLAGSESRQLFALINPDISREAIARMTAWYEEKGLKPWNNFTYIPIDDNGNIDWKKWEQMYQDAGIPINKETWRRALAQDISMAANSAMYPPASPNPGYERED